MSSGGDGIKVRRRLSAAEREAVVAIDRAAAILDGVAALDSQVHLDLQYGDESVRHLLACAGDDGAITGYGHLRSTNAAHQAFGHLVVDPRSRRAGRGAALLSRMQAAAPRHSVAVWAHGDLAPARAFAERTGMGPVRELWRMERPLDGPLAEPDYPSGVSVRAFDPDRDGPAWLAVNAAAFAGHPEQGSVTSAGLAQRIAQPDFDPGGFFLAEREGDLIGFHWTKVHPADESGSDGVGEVYVLGVHPDAQGLGLGKALTLTGLRSLQRRSVGTVMLYTEAANAAAVAVYRKLGFTRAAKDVLYAMPDNGAGGH